MPRGSVTVDVCESMVAVTSKRQLSIGDRIAVRFDVADGSNVRYMVSACMLGKHPLSKEIADPTFVDTANVEFDDGKFISADFGRQRSPAAQAPMNRHHIVHMTRHV